MKEFLRKIGLFFKKTADRIGKRNLAAAAAVVLLAGAVVLNWRLFSPDPPDGDADAVKVGAVYYTAGALSGGGDVPTDADPSDPGADSYFASAAVSRQRSRDEALEVLRLIVDNGDAVEASRSAAMAQMQEIAAAIEAESNIETLVCAKGFEDCVAVIGSGICTVIVRSDTLLPSEIAQIQEIVYEQSGILPSGVKLIEQR